MLYSALFMRFSVKVIPWNPLLLAVHVTNESVQVVQAYRYYNYH